MGGILSSLYQSIQVWRFTDPEHNEEVKKSGDEYNNLTDEDLLQMIVEVNMSEGKEDLHSKIQQIHLRAIFENDDDRVQLILDNFNFDNPNSSGLSDDYIMKKAFEMVFESDNVDLLKSIRSVKNMKDVSIFETAVEYGSLNILKYAIEELEIDPFRKDNWALKEASAYGDLDIVKYLVDLGANVEDYGEEAIDYAAHNNRVEVSKYLLKQGADMSLVYTRGRTRSYRETMQKWLHEEYKPFLQSIMDLPTNAIYEYMVSEKN